MVANERLVIMMLRVFLREIVRTSFYVTWSNFHPLSLSITTERISISKISIKRLRKNTRGPFISDSALSTLCMLLKGCNPFKNLM